MSRALTFKIFIVFLIISFAIYLSISNKYDEKGNINNAFPNLISNLKKINKITIQDLNAQQSISKDGEKWYLDNYNKYPVDIGIVNNFFLNLSNSTFIDKKDISTEGFKKLGLDNSFNEKVFSKRIKIYSTNGALFDFIIGKKVSENKKNNINYFRNTNVNQVWLLKNNLTFPDQDLSWINTNIFKIARWRVQKVSIVDKIEKTSFTIYRDSYSDQNYKYLNLPKGYEFLNNYSQNAIAASFEGIIIKNIIPSSPESNHKILRNIELNTFDGLVINFQVIKIEDTNYIKINANSDKSIRKELKSDGEKIINIPSMKIFKDIEKEAFDLEITKNWLYEFDKNTMNEFQKNKGDVIKKK